MILSRRQILASMGVLGLSAIGFTTLPFLRETTSTSMGFVLGGGVGYQNGEKIYFLSVIDLDASQPSPRFVATKFLGHGISIHPQKPYIMSVFEKKGPGACELDLSTGHIRDIFTDSSRYFYGHGTYTSDGAKLLTTETVLNSGEGMIVIRDAKTLKIEGQFPSFGANPHDCQLIQEGRVIAITNGGAQFGKKPLPSVTYVDVSSQKLLEKFEIDDPHFNTGHLAISSSLELAVSSAPRLGLSESSRGAISLLSKERILTTLKEPEEIVSRLKSETLSLCIDDQRGVLAATSPAGNMVSFWELPSGKFISSLHLPNPRGIILSADNNYFLISYAKQANLCFVAADDLKIVDDLNIAKAGFSGSHLYLLNV